MAGEGGTNRPESVERSIRAYRGRLRRQTASWFGQCRTVPRKPLGSPS